jgi:hypothetical protein
MRPLCSNVTKVKFVLDEHRTIGKREHHGNTGNSPPFDIDAAPLAHSRPHTRQHDECHRRARRDIPSDHGHRGGPRRSGRVGHALAQVGQSICPLLVQPGSNFASNAVQMSGNGGLAPPIAGFLAGQAIQAQCPAFMTAIANGTMPFQLTGAATAPTQFGLPGASPPPVAPPLPGMTAPAPSPLQLPAL